MRIYATLELTVTIFDTSDIVRTSPDNIEQPGPDWGA